MAFCINCGEKLVEGSKFCANCGTPAPTTRGGVQKEPVETPPPVETPVKESKKATAEEETKEEPITKRQTVYDGEVHKCPSCGETIQAFVAKCPTCGFELNRKKVSSSLQKFIDEIKECEKNVANSPSVEKTGWASWSNGNRFWWVILNLIFMCIPLIIYLVLPLILINATPKLSSEEKKLSSAIENFPFPNDRESILAALVFAKEKIDFISKEKIDRKSAYWIRLWCSKAEQLKNRADMLFPDDVIVKQSYAEILDDQNRVKKTIKIKAIAGLVALAAIIIFSIIRFGVFGNNGGYTGGYNSESQSPTIEANAGTDADKGIFSYEIRNYIGKNAATVGKVDGDYIVDEYGSGKLRIVFVSNDGICLNLNDLDLRKQYVVVGQNMKAGNKITIVHDRDSQGRPYSNLVDYQSQEEIVLFVAVVGDSSYKPTYTEPQPTLDRHKYYVRDYVGRNAASFGAMDGDDRIDEYGAGKLIINFTAADGSFVDVKNMNELKKYIVTAQDISAGSLLEIEYDKDSSGNEYDNLVQSQNHEIITLTVKKIDDSVINKMPEITAENSVSQPTVELQIKYKVLSNGKAEITGFSGDGNHATIDSKIDGHEVIRIGDNAFKDCTTLTSVLFWADVEEIGNSAFKGCTALTEISIPNETKKIGDNAFQGCTKLASAILWGDPDIGKYAFAGCTSLESISIGGDTKSVGEHAFDGCTALSSAIVWGDDTIIGKDAFANCPNLKDKPIQE